MKIVFLTPGYIWGPSGGMRVIYEYANQLVTRGHHVTVVHPQRLKNVPVHRIPQLNVRAFAHRSREWILGKISKPSIDWQTVNEKVKLLYVSNSDARYIPNADVVCATGWSTVQSVLEYPKTKGEKCYLIQGYEAYHARKELVDATWRAPIRKVVIARWLLELGKELECDGLTYIPNAIDHERYRLTQPIEGRSQQVAMLFSNTQIKGSADGIEALGMVRERYPNLKAVFFGVSRPKPWIPKWVTYHRDPPQDFLVNQIYNRSSIFLAPSWSEGSPLPPAEAACCGCALVATDIGGFREYIENGVTGLLSPSRDPKALAENICLLLANEDLRVRLAKAAQAFVAGLSWEHSTNLLEIFLDSLTGNRKSTPEGLSV